MYKNKKIILKNDTNRKFYPNNLILFNIILLYGINYAMKISILVVQK